MRTITDIGIFFYNLFNVSTLTSLLDGGGVHRNQRPNNSTSNDIVIITRNLDDNFYKGIYNGIVQIVIITKKIGGLPDLQKQYNIENQVIDILNDSLEIQKQKELYLELVNTSEHDNYSGQQDFSSLYLTLKIHKT